MQNNCQLAEELGSPETSILEHGSKAGEMVSFGFVFVARMLR